MSEEKIKRKAAICFSGQLRNLESGYSYTKPNIIDSNTDDWDIDFFVHSWLDLQSFGKTYSAPSVEIASNPISNDVLYKLYEFYNPKKLMLEKQIKFDEKNYAQNKASLIIPQYSLSKCYSIEKSIGLKRKYEQENNFEYDLVMSLRTDLAHKSKVNFNDFDLSYVNTSTHGVWMGTGMDVTKSIMNSKNADLYATILDHVENYFNTGTLFCDEHFFHRHCDELKIPINRTPLLSDIEILRN